MSLYPSIALDPPLLFNPLPVSFYFSFSLVSLYSLGKPLRRAVINTHYSARAYPFFPLFSFSSLSLCFLSSSTLLVPPYSPTYLNMQGVAAAISAAWYNSTQRVVLIEPSPYAGGMCVAGGIGLRDLGNETSFYNTIGHTWTMMNAKYYGIPLLPPHLLLSFSPLLLEVGWMKRCSPTLLVKLDAD